MRNMLPSRRPTTPHPRGSSVNLQHVACLFCRIIAREADAHLVLDEPQAVGFLDARPVFKGHVLVVPREHVETLTDLAADQLAPYFETVQRVAAAVVTACGAQGSFVAMNNVVSQSVPHLHVHVVPRTKGDGLRGFFWPRTRYDGDTEARAHADRIREALALPG